MDIEKFNSVGEWRETMQEAGYSVPLPLCIGLSKIMKGHNCGFSEALKLLMQNRKIFLAGKTIVYDLTGDLLAETRRDE